MRLDEIEVRVERHDEELTGMTSARDGGEDASLGELLKRLTNDTTALVRQEVALAKAEMKETGTRLGKDAAKVGVAAALAFMGGLALTAFVVIGLGNLLGGRYWLSALLVGLVAFGVGYAMVKSAMNDISERGIAPRQTLDTLREDKQWARQRARELKHDLTTNPRDNSTPSPRL